VNALGLEPLQIIQRGHYLSISRASAADFLSRYAGRQFHQFERFLARRPREHRKIGDEHVDDIDSGQR